jgi:hypothetical protein
MKVSPALYSCTCPIATHISLDANGEILVVKSVQSERPSEDVALWLDTLATCIPLLASSDMYVAIGHVLIEIFKHVLAVWNKYSVFDIEKTKKFGTSLIFC